MLANEHYVIFKRLEHKSKETMKMLVKIFTFKELHVSVGS